MTRLDLTQSKLPNTICNQEQGNTQKQKLMLEEAPSETACVEHAPAPKDPLQQPNTKNSRSPPNTAKEVERSHHARSTEWKTLWLVMTTRRSPESIPAVSRRGRTGGQRQARLGGACRPKGCETE